MSLTRSIVLSLTLWNFTYGIVPEFSCDFQESLCSFESQSIYPSQLWSRETVNDEANPLQPINFPPNSDNYLKLASFIGKLKSPQVHLDGDYCFSLDYYVFAFRANLILHVARCDESGRLIPEEKRGRTAIFSRNHESSFVDKWNSYQKTITFNDSDYKLFIRGESIFENAIAMSNLKLEEGPCADSGEKFCDFDGQVYNEDQDACEWLEFITTVDNPTKTWRTRNPWPWTYPIKDFTTRSRDGSFLRGPNPEHVNDTMIIRIRKIFKPDDGAHCFIFYQNTVGDSRFQVLEQAVGSNVTNVLYEPAEVESYWNWQRRMVDIDPIVPITISLKLLPHTDNEHFDALRLIKGPCPKQISCDFKEDLCGFSQRNDNKNWKIGKGRVPGISDERIEEQQRRLAETYSDNYLYSPSLGFMYNDTYGRPKWIEPFNYIASDAFDKIPATSRGEFCLKFSFWYDEALKIEISHFRVMDAQVSPNLRTRFSDERPWATGFTDVKSYDSFRLRFESSHNNFSEHYEIMKVFRMRKVDLLEGPCDQHINGTVSPPQTFEEVSFHCYQTGHYVPMYRSCDGVIDCPMGEDEGDQCEPHQCDHGGIPCTIRKHKICLKDSNKLCNGIADCNDGIDEDPRLCTQESFCANYCLNDGECNHGSYKCDCVGSYAGKRCAADQ